jgi:hypothetical protein
LPDGTVIATAPLRYAVGEHYFSAADAAFQEMNVEVDASFKFSGIQHMVRSSIDRCDADIRKELSSGL